MVASYLYQVHLFCIRSIFITGWKGRRLAEEDDKQPVPVRSYTISIVQPTTAAWVSTVNGGHHGRWSETSRSMERKR